MSNNSSHCGWGLSWGLCGPLWGLYLIFKNLVSNHPFKTLFFAENFLAILLTVSIVISLLAYAVTVFKDFHPLNSSALEIYLLLERQIYGYGLNRSIC
jgi:hypothetical protein